MHRLSCRRSRVAYKVIGGDLIKGTAHISPAIMQLLTPAVLWPTIVSMNAAYGRIEIAQLKGKRAATPQYMQPVFKLYLIKIVRSEAGNNFLFSNYEMAVV